MSAAMDREAVPVTQADRDAAFSYWLYRGSLTPDDYRAVKWLGELNRGKRDDNEIVQAFARHRLAALDSRAGDAGEVVAWAFELATCIHGNGTYSGWDESPRLSLTKPCVPEGSIRNLRPLYAATPAPAVDAVPAGEVDGRERLALAAEAQGHFSVAHWVRFAPAFEEFDSIRISIALAALSHGEGR